MPWTVALGQMDVTPGDPARNRAVVADLAREAARGGAEVLLVPELWASGYVLDRAADFALSLEESVADLAQIATSAGIGLYGSTLVRRADGGIGNTAVLVDRDGRHLATYSKVHLFGLMDEPRYLAAGTAPTLAETPWGKTGLAICYDLRFPELFRTYAFAGAEVVLLVAQWPMPRLAHWQTLLRARAIENQAFVIACNRVGSSGGNTFFGHSTVIDPWGEILFEADDRPGLHRVEIDPARLAAARKRLPVLGDRRPAAYHFPGE